MTTVTVKLPEELGLRLAVAAKRRQINKSEIIRQLLEQGLGATSQQPPVSCYDLAKDLCGSVKNAPRDLSTNKRHFEGFGQ